jgi:GTP diphosphokinase / guanosine-3',5'-bis(diphosphate) 3'-diphosphatase
MDENAERGHASHWLYKDSGKKDNTDKWIHHLRSMLENPQESFDATSEVQAKNESADYIFVFTPQGDLKKLRHNATVLDFAYEIHTGMGEKCSGGRVNNHQVPIKHVLNNGDQVEILTSRNQKPSLDWLSWVATNRARNKIKRYLREARYNRSEEGKDILRRKLSQLDMPFNDEVLNKLMSHFTIDDPLELYQWLAEDKIEVSDIKKVLLPAEITAEPEIRRQPKAKVIRRPDAGAPDEYAIMIEGNPGISEYKLAKCCMPVTGEKIFGFVTVGAGIKVHSVNCPNALQMRTRYSYRVVKAEWVRHTEKSSKVFEIVVTGTDRLGILNDITRVISEDLRVNMRSVSLDSKSGQFEGNIKVFVGDKKRLDALLRRLLKVKGVQKAVVV